MSEFITYLHDVFAGFGPIRTKRMFGGHGVYHRDLMFALVANDVLYLKADDESAIFFEQLGLRRFEYNREGKTLSMAYYQAPEDIYDNPDLARTWAVLAYDAAVRSRKTLKKTGNKS
jgi:DNA transformation protein